MVAEVLPQEADVYEGYNLYWIRMRRQRLLAKRQFEVLWLMSLGFVPAEIAAKRNRSVITIEGHQRHIYRRLDVNNQYEALREGVRMGILPSIKPGPAWRKSVTLSLREEDILLRIGKGQTYQEIADWLKTTREKIDYVAERIRKKLNAHVPSEGRDGACLRGRDFKAYILAIRAGLLPPILSEYDSKEHISIAERRARAAHNRERARYLQGQTNRSVAEIAEAIGCAHSTVWIYLRPADYTERHLEVLRYVGQGLKNQEIADKMGVSLPYIKRLLGEMCRYLGIIGTRDIRMLAYNAAKRRGLL